MAPETLESTIAREPQGAGMRDRRCDHCGNALRGPNDSTLSVFGEHGTYCCVGCRAVAETLRELGLDDYYRLRGETKTEPAVGVDRDYAEFDEPTFFERYVRPAALALPSTTEESGTSCVEPRRIELLVEGAHCAACIWVIEQLPRLLPGVLEARLELPRGVLRITFDGKRLALSELARMLARLGYPPHPLRGTDEQRLRKTEERAHLFRLGIAFTCFANAMLFAFALYGEYFEGMANEWKTTFRLLGFASALVALLFPGRVFLRGAISSLRAREPHMDLPVAIALSVGTVWGGVNAITGHGEVYFESLTAVIFLLSIGRYLQFRQQRSAADAIELLFTLTPRFANRIESGGEEKISRIPADALRIGDRVVVHSGETVPADGVIIDGESDFDLSLLTGESVPQRLVPGDDVPAGAINVTTMSQLVVRSIGSDTRLGKILSLMRHEASTRAPVVRLADRAAHRLVKLVLALAFLTFALWLRVSPGVAAEHAIALLIVTCPCALGLATPLAVEVALGRAARNKLLVKGGDVIERLGDRKAGGIVLLDKTGTLTTGRATLLEFSGEPRDLLRVAALERGLSHPYAKAFFQAAEDQASRGEPEPVVSACRSIPGGGVTGEVDGEVLFVGNKELLARHGIALDTSTRATEARFAASGLSPIFVARHDQVVAVAGFCDPPREDGARVVASLRERGFEVGLLSGDHATIARRIGAAVGIDPLRCEGGASPERKVAAVAEAAQRFGRVIMVGDGVNDAAALARADVGIALKGGAEASLEAADVYLARSDLQALVVLIDGCRRTLGVIRGNLLASLSYNAVAATLAIAGHIHPLAAAVLMPLSSLTVVAMSFRRRTFEDSERS